MSTHWLFVRLLVSTLLLAVLGGTAVVSGQGADIAPPHALDASSRSCCPEDARGETGAIFVAATGRAGNPGTAAYPIQSLSEALAAAALEGKTAIYLAGGEYSEADTIRLISGFSICVGYEPGTWTRTGSAATIADVKASTAMVAENLMELTTLSNFAITATNAGYGASSYGIKVNGCSGGVRHNQYIRSEMCLQTRYMIQSLPAHYTREGRPCAITQHTRPEMPTSSLSASAPPAA